MSDRVQGDMRLKRILRVNNTVVAKAFSTGYV